MEEGLSCLWLLQEWAGLEHVTYSSVYRRKTARVVLSGLISTLEYDC